MNTTLNPYVQFDNGKAREAMTFYQTVFGGELDIRTFGDLHVPDAPADGVMHSALMVDGQTILMCSDNMMPGREGFAGFSLSLSGSDAAEMRGYFAALSADGSVTVPLSVQSWGDEFGMVLDKFGVNWFVNISATQA